MIKIDMPKVAINEFKDSVLANFEPNEVACINKILKQKLKGFKFDVNLSRLITLNYDEMLCLNDFITTHKIESDAYFLSLYHRKVTQKIRVKHISNLNISVCLYCNRNYIINFDENSKTTAELDHFFSKSKYPYLAICVYNLIPSCHTCNQRKSDSSKEIYYPFKESFDDDVKFKITLEDASLNDKNSINLSYNIMKNKDKANEHLKIFNIKNLYNEHKDLVFELLQKSKIYNESYIDELVKNYEGSVFSDKNELLRLITGAYMDNKDINKRPFNKLIKDVSEQIGLV